MGKGNRNKLDRAQERIDSPEAYLEQRRKLNKKKKNKTGLGVTITCIVLVTVIVLSLVLGALNSLGVFARMTNTISTKNFTVTEAMMTFFYNEYIMNWYSQYQMYIMYGMYEVNFLYDLKEQPCSLLNNEGSWHDYFMNMTVNQVSMYLEYAEGAKAAGIELDDQDKEEINDAVKSIKKALKENGETIADRYGESVSAGDIRKCYELIQLASKFNDYKLEELDKLIRGDDDKINAYPDEHKEDFYTADYLSYTITVKSNDKKFAGKATLFEEAKKEALEHANIIASAKDIDSFFAEIKAYIELISKEEETTTGDASSETESNSTETESDSTEAQTPATETATTKEIKIEDYEHEISYGTESDLEKWIFVDGANENDCKVLEETKTEQTTKDSTSSEKVDVETYKVTAYILKTRPHLNDAPTFDLGYFVSTDKAVAEEIRNAFMSGEMSAEALEKLGQDKYKELAKAESTIQVMAEAGKNFKTDAFQTNYPALHTWLNEEREAGDVSEVIEIVPTQNGQSTYYVVCYFERVSEENVWQAQAINSLVGEAMDEWYMGADGNGGQRALTPVMENERSKKRIGLCDYMVNLAYQMYYGTRA